jgi:catechol 2,3-dioxygenase-like lactoylglutathione lyase family enzyme
VKIEGVHHVAVEVTDLDAALAFYSGVLGMRIRDDRPDVSPGAWLDAGRDQVHLVLTEQPPPTGRRAHTAFPSTTSTRGSATWQHTVWPRANSPSCPERHDRHCSATRSGIGSNSPNGDRHNAPPSREEPT